MFCRLAMEVAGVASLWHPPLLGFQAKVAEAAGHRHLEVPACLVEAEERRVSSQEAEAGEVAVVLLESHQA